MIAEWIAYVWEELSSTLRSATCKLCFSQSWKLICESEFLHESNKHHNIGSHLHIRFKILWCKKWIIKEGIKSDNIYLFTKKHSCQLANISMKSPSHAETTILEESAMNINSILSANVGRSVEIILNGRFELV